MTTVREAVAEGTRRIAAAGAPADEARQEAKILLARTAGLTPEAMIARPEAALGTGAEAAFCAAVARRERREPLAYIVGEREFYGLPFAVTPAVLIPRPETEFVVEVALGHLAGREAARVVDVGTGSGAIAVAVAVHAPRALVWATDVSAAALEVAARNAVANGVADRVTLAEGDLLAPVADAAPFDVIASNPPYIPAADIDGLEPEVRDWEPRLALGTHPNGLHYYLRLAAEAPPLLAPGGLLAVEVGQGQAEGVAALWTAARLTDVSISPDYAGIGRVVSGRRPA